MTIRYQVQTNIAGDWHPYGAGRLYRDYDAAHRRLCSAITAEHGNPAQPFWRTFFKIAQIEVSGPDRVRGTAYRTVAQLRYDRLLREWHNLYFGGRW